MMKVYLYNSIHNKNSKLDYYGKMKLENCLKDRRLLNKC